MMTVLLILGCTLFLHPTQAVHHNCEQNNLATCNVPLIPMLAKRNRFGSCLHVSEKEIRTTRKDPSYFLESTKVRPRWRHRMGVLPHYWPFVGVNLPFTGGIPSQSASDADPWCFYWCQTRGQAAEWLVIWDATTAVWSHCNALIDWCLHCMTDAFLMIFAKAFSSMSPFVFMANVTDVSHTGSN